MATTYDIPQYLLDRTNIQECAEMMYMHFDRGEVDKLTSDVFAKEIVVDYTALFGGQPNTHKGAELAEHWKELRAKAASSQHAIFTIIPSLPQPGTGSPPTTAKAVGNGQVLIKSHRDNLVENKGRMYMDFVKLTGVSGNPWRICGIKVELVWQQGSWEQLGKDFEEHSKA